MPASNPATNPLSRPLAVALVALLAIHAGILVWAAYGPLTAPLRVDYDGVEFAVVTAVALAIFGAIVVRWTLMSWTIALAVVAIVAAALLTPGAVAVVFLMLLNAHVVGQSIVAYARRGRAADDTTISPDAVTLAGVTVWIGIIAITAGMKIHYAPVYAAALFLPLALSWRRTQTALRSFVNTLTWRGNAPGATERGWIALLLAIVVLHLFIAAKPDVGSDANTMHLQVPLLMAEHHRWRFDVGRFAWAVMPLGADYMYAAANFLGGEQAARLLNLAFGALLCRIAYALARRYARREIALASVCLLASTPLAFMLTGSLFVENLWIAYVLAALLVTLDFAASRSPAVLVIAAFAIAGAMACKAISMVWLAPLVLCLGYLLQKGRAWRQIGPAGMALLIAAIAIGVWPYANAWWRTGNPLFPFMNAVFRSPLFDATASFTNPLYLTPLKPWSLYETIVESGRFVEGTDGAAGFHWLLLLPVIAVGFLRKRPLTQWLCLGLAVWFFAAIFVQQSYLRYLLPAFVLIAVLGAWTLDDVVDARAARIAILVVGGLLCLVNVRLIHAGSWPNAKLCAGCAFDRKTRDIYVAIYLPDRLVGDYLNRALPDARVGFLMLNAPSPSGFVGYSRSANWHDVAMYAAIANARSAEDVLAIARRFGLTHAVFNEPMASPIDDAIQQFRARYTTPVWASGARSVAAIVPGFP